MAERVAVLAPMVSEMKPVVRAFGLAPAGRLTGVGRNGGATQYRGRVGDVDVVATMTGIGMQLAADVTERLLASEPVDHVMVVGIAGGVAPAVQVGDVVVPSVVVDGSSGAEFSPAELPDVEPRGRLVSSDDFHVANEQLAQLRTAGVIALDMETAAVAAVCERRGRPWSVVRAISDMADDHPIGEAVLQLARPDGSPNVPGLLRYMSRHPRKLPVLVKLGRDSQLAANAAARTAARACRRLGAA
jgi:adenosylhomocysteine nucleosidase